MIKQGIKRGPVRSGGFTLVELLIVVAILAVLSGAAYIGIQRSQARVMNEKVMDDLVSISNALEQYKQDEGTYPNIADDSLELRKDKNINCFASDTTYSHDCENTDETAFIQTQVDNILLTKRYLQEVPTDPRTQSRYVYGVTTDGQFFQVAGNYLTDEGSYIAKVEGNLKMGYSLPSLIRAFDGPNFVMDGEGYLPYSPDHLSITARLYDLSGTVTKKIDGNETNAQEGDVVKPGDTIHADAGATVAIYFSDGSMTYLDGDVAGGDLLIQPNTEVQKNDEDGIVTKIRIKLFHGKIWSKVARLAAESEFNVETTEAIAGVRGTEFGINAIGNELIVLSGTVVAREMTSLEQDAAINEEEPFGFDSTDINVFPLNKVANGTGSFDKSLFTIPGSLPGDAMPLFGTVPNPANQARIESTFYKGPFNNNYLPRIKEVNLTGTGKVVFEILEDVKKIRAVHANGTKDYTADNNEITDDPMEETLTIIGNMDHIAGKGPVKFQFIDENGNTTGYSNPAVPVESGQKLIADDIYNLYVAVQGCQGNYDGVDITGPLVVKAGSSGNMYKAEAIYSSPNCKKDITTQCAWDPQGLPATMAQSGDLTMTTANPGNLTIKCIYNSKNDSNPPIVSVISGFNAACWGSDLDNAGDDVGHWDAPNSLCWVLGDPAAKCTDTCDNKLPPNLADCDTFNQLWNDPGCTICQALGGVGCAVYNNAAQAPFRLSGTACRSRGTPPLADCTAVALGIQERVCPCRLQ